jgi:hypothetical protein
MAWPKLWRKEGNQVPDSVLEWWFPPSTISAKSKPTHAPATAGYDGLEGHIPGIQLSSDSLFPLDQSIGCRAARLRPTGIEPAILHFPISERCEQVAVRRIRKEKSAPSICLKRMCKRKRHFRNEACGAATAALAQGPRYDLRPSRIQRQPKKIGIPRSDNSIKSRVTAKAENAELNRRLNCVGANWQHCEAHIRGKWLGRASRSAPCQIGYDHLHLNWLSGR